MARKKGGKRHEGMGRAEEELCRSRLQAILLADSFDTKFQPITLERPKVLLPLVNVPMLDYSLAWLESSGVEEVFVFCCAHSKQVMDHLDKSNWFDQPNFLVKTVVSHNASGAGDALRLIYGQNVIRGDFILVSGDTVSNMSLSKALREHKERRRKDSNAVMTMVIKQSNLSLITRESRLGTEELFMAIDPETKQLLYYEDTGDNFERYLSLDKAMITDDKQDCYIDICSPEVLSLFTDNFDYQHLRHDFVKGLLVDDVTGYKIFTHEIRSSYASRIDNYRSYDTVSRDIIQRWTYPFMPDVLLFGNSSTKLQRQEGIYLAPEVKQSRSVKIFPFTVIGTGTSIGDNTEISNSVVGEGCTIGSNVTLECVYIWDNVTIEDDCKLKYSIVCDGVIMKFGAALEPGVVLSFEVMVGRSFIVPAYSMVSSLQQPIKQDSEEVEYAGNSSGITKFPAISGTLHKLNEEQRAELPHSQEFATSEVGDGGVGFIWLVSEGGQEEEWRHSVAPVPVDKLVGIMQITNDEADIPNEDGAVLPTSGDPGPESTTNDSNEDADSLIFEKEVEATFQRAVEENVKDHVILEVNALRLSYNMTSADCAGSLFYSLMKWALDTPHHSLIELLNVVTAAISDWNELLKYYLPSIDEEIEVILKFEEMCLESAKEYYPLFAKILECLYDTEIIPEDAILEWASEKENAEESDKVFVKQSETFIQWLKETSEED